MLDLDADVVCWSLDSRLRGNDDTLDSGLYAV